jgi:hypothetical protein
MKLVSPLSLLIIPILGSLLILIISNSPLIPVFSPSNKVQSNLIIKSENSLIKNTEKKDSLLKKIALITSLINFMLSIIM